MKVVYNLLLGLLILTSCRDKADPTGNISEIDSTYLKKYPGIISKLGREIKTADGYYKLVQVSNKKCKIEWGNNSFKNLSADEYHFLVCDSIRIEHQNEDFIILKSKITVQGWIYICLPLMEKKNEIIIENPILLQRDKNIVVSDGFRRDTVLLITNLASGQVQAVIESTEPCSLYFHNCLDTLYISGDNLLYKFRLDLNREKDDKRIQRKIEIRI